jgi:hypothetical protein
LKIEYKGKNPNKNHKENKKNAVQKRVKEKKKPSQIEILLSK